eukprot:218699-Pelagomonas_calceolata.AAC.2
MISQLGPTHIGPEALVASESLFGQLRSPMYSWLLTSAPLFHSLPVYMESANAEHSHCDPSSPSHAMQLNSRVPCFFLLVLLYVVALFVVGVSCLRCWMWYAAHEVHLLCQMCHALHTSLLGTLGGPVGIGAWRIKQQASSVMLGCHENSAMLLAGLV